MENLGYWPWPQPATSAQTSRASSCSSSRSRSSSSLWVSSPSSKTHIFVVLHLLDCIHLACLSASYDQCIDAQTMITFMFECIRLPVHPCPNHNNQREGGGRSQNGALASGDGRTQADGQPCHRSKNKNTAKNGGNYCIVLLTKLPKFRNPKQ